MGARAKGERGAPNSVVAALEVCVWCPVRGECLRHAITETAYEAMGVWGGTSQGERMARTPRGRT